MDLVLTPEDIAFRDEVRAFLKENVTDDMRRAGALTAGFLDDPEVAIDFHKVLYEKGWVAPHWPKEYGGTGWTPVQRNIFENECARAGAPSYNGMARQFVGPMLMRYGSQEQKDFFLPRILKGEDHWCQGYSEPGSGSDLASLKTKAESDGDDYIVNGQKIWTTHAHKSNRIFALVRTSSEGKKQAGITFLLMEMETPGITVRPIIGNGGDHEFNEVFFDNVRTPKSGRVGEENQGWEIAKYLLEFERGGAPSAGKVRSRFRKLAAAAKKYCPDDPDMASRIAELGIDIDAMEMLEIKDLSERQMGGNPGPVSSLLKLRWSQIRQETTELMLDVVGADALRWAPERPLYEALQLPPEEEELLSLGPRYMNYRAYTILGGTSEIQTTILAKTMLGL